MQLALRLALLFLPLWLLSCAAKGPPVSSTFDPLVRFPASATVEWDDAANVLPKDPSSQELDLDAVLHEVAGEAFGARGYRVTTSGSADYALSYQVAVNTRVGATTSAVGSLWLNLAELPSRRRVWVGFTKADVYVGLTREERKARLLEALDLMLAEFPPSQRPPED